MALRSVDERLVRAFTGPRKPIIVAGAGVSMASSQQAATWVGLIEGAIRHAAELDIDCRDLPSPADSDPLALATEVQKRLANRFHAWLVNYLDSWELNSPAAIDALVRLQVPLTTTNYDKFLSKRSRTEPVPATNTDFAQRVIGGAEGILHFHGVYSDADSVVFGDGDYRRLQDDARRQFNQRIAAAAHTMIFVGCGGTLDDPNFGELLRWVESWPGGSHQHFRLNNAKEIASQRQRPEPAPAGDDGDSRGHRSSVLTITYGDDYRDLGDYLDQLVAEVETHRRTASAAVSAERARVARFRMGAPSLDAKARLVDVAPPDQSRLAGVAFDSSGSLLAAVSDQRTTVWEVNPVLDGGSWTSSWRKPNSAAVFATAFLSDGRLAVGTAKGLRVHAAEDGRADSLGSQAPISCLTIDRAGSLLTARSALVMEGSGHSRIQMVDDWGDARSEDPASLSAGSAMVHSIAAGPGRWLATDDRWRWRVWVRLGDGLRGVWSGDIVGTCRVAWNRGGDRLAVSSHTSVTVYDTADLTDQSDAELQELIDSTTRWRLPTWCVVTHLAGVTALALTGDGNFLAVGGNDGTVTVWQITREGGPVAAQVEVSPSHHVYALSFDAGGSLLAVAAANQLHLCTLG